MIHFLNCIPFVIFENFNNYLVIFCVKIKIGLLILLEKKKNTCKDYIVRVKDEITK